MSVGQAGDWRIHGPGVAPVHAYVYFDGTTLYVQSALAGQPILVAGQPVANQWQPLPLGAPLDIGGVRLVLRPAAPVAAPQPPPWQAAPPPAAPPAPAFDDMEQTRAAPPRAAGGAPHWPAPGYGDDDEHTRMAPAAGRPANASLLPAPTYDDDDEHTLLVSPDAAPALGAARPAAGQPLQSAPSKPSRPPSIALELPPASEMTRVAPLTEDARAAVVGLSAPLPAAGAPAAPMQMPPVSPLQMPPAAGAGVPGANYQPPPAPGANYQPPPAPGAGVPGANYQPPPPPALAPTQIVRSVKESPLDKFRALPPIRKVLLVVGPFGLAAATWLLLADNDPAPAPKKPATETPAPTPSVSQTASTATPPPLPPTATAEPTTPPPVDGDPPSPSDEPATPDKEPTTEPAKPPAGGRRSKEPPPLSLERQAVDAYVSGDLEKARTLYGQLQVEHPENPTFAEIVTILDSKRPAATPR